MPFISAKTFRKQVRLPSFVAWLMWVLLQKWSSGDGSKKRVNQNRASDVRTQQAKLQGCCHLCPFLYDQWEMEFGSCNCSFHVSLAFVEATTLFIPVFPGLGHSVDTLPGLGPCSLQIPRLLLLPQALFCLLTFVSRASLPGWIYTLNKKLSSAR